MKDYLIGAATIVAALSVAPAADAAVFTPADVSNFAVSFDPDGTISANIGNRGLSGAFEDTFNFDLLSDGTGSGGVIATFSSMRNMITLTFASINGTPIPIETLSNGFTSASAGGINLFAGANSIVIRGTAARNASYGGNITFVPNVPEPATWAMMLIGFGMVGAATRYRRRGTKVVYG